MLKKLSLIVILSLLYGCNIDSYFFSDKTISNEHKIWSFIEFQVPNTQGILEDYYYFGLVSEDLYEKIKSHQVKDGLIFMESVRYWNNDDVIESYDDEIYSDELAFRIEHIVKFERVKKEPEIGFKYDDESYEEDNLTE